MNTLDELEVKKIAYLARINIPVEKIPQMTEGLKKTFDILSQLHTVDTKGVEPMSNPFDAVQRLREDIVTETDHRDEYQKIAPAIENGLYLVPKVIE